MAGHGLLLHYSCGLDLFRTQKITIIFFIIVRNGVFALFTYLNLYGGFTCLVVVFFLPLLRFFTREFVGVSLREVLSVFEVLSTLEVSS